MRLFLLKGIVLLSSYLLLVGCSKSTDGCDPEDVNSPCYVAPVGGAVKLLLTELHSNGHLVSQNFYDDENRIIRFKPYDDKGASDMSIYFSYNANGLLSLAKYLTSDGETLIEQQYVYDKGKQPISMVESTPSDPKSTPIDWTYFYDGDLLVKEVAVDRASGVTGVVTEFSYDDKGRLTSWTVTQGGMWTGTYTLGQYDDKKTAQWIGSPHYWQEIQTNMGNPGVEKYSSIVPSLNKDLDVKYTYNKEGYPTKAELYKKGTDDLVETREYFYQKAK